MEVTCVFNLLHVCDVARHSWAFSALWKVICEQRKGTQLTAERLCGGHHPCIQDRSHPERRARRRGLSSCSVAEADCAALKIL